MNLLVHGDPGARPRFVGAWLSDQLDNAGFDVGTTAWPRFRCFHTLHNRQDLIDFVGPRVRVKFTFDQLSRHLLLFLRKNVHTQLPDFTRDEYSLETFAKLYIFARECLEQEQAVDYSLYDHVIRFEDTFDIEKLKNLYQQVNGDSPGESLIQQAHKNNQLNQIDIDLNHACSIAALVLSTETQLGLLEKNRRWSVTEIYATTQQSDLYNVIKSCIHKENYA